MLPIPTHCSPGVNYEAVRLMGQGHRVSLRVRLLLFRMSLDLSDRKPCIWRTLCFIKCHGSGLGPA